MSIFDPNSAALENSGIFGFISSIEDAKLILLPVPWDATQFYGTGAHMGPQAVFEASKYLEIFDSDLGDLFETGIAMEDIPRHLIKMNKEARKMALPVIKKGNPADDCRLLALADEVNDLCRKMNEHVYGKTRNHLANNKLVGMLGGDHSAALGSIKAHLEKYPDMGILQIDAHCDLRKAFQGFDYSHASVMFNVLNETPLKKLVQIGIRGYCEEEDEKIRNSGGRITTFFYDQIYARTAKGGTWDEICGEIILSLPRQIYISFDIDGLDPSLCPSTGTPVPGGLEFEQTAYMMKKIVESGRTIVGFDLVEVAPNKYDTWDATAGSHMLYELCGWCLKSQKIATHSSPSEKNYYPFSSSEGK